MDTRPLRTGEFAAQIGSFEVSKWVSGLDMRELHARLLICSIEVLHELSVYCNRDKSAFRAGCKYTPKSPEEPHFWLRDSC